MLRLLRLLVVLFTRFFRSRRDLLDDAIVLNERHLKRLMNNYVRYYHYDRSHLALAKETPAGREAVSKSGVGTSIIAMPRVGDLHHRYDLAARASAANIPCQN